MIVVSNDFLFFCHVERSETSFTNLPVAMSYFHEGKAIVFHHFRLVALF